MGVDLTLLPVTYETKNGVLICQVVLELGRGQLVDRLIGLERKITRQRIIAPLADMPEHVMNELVPEDPSLSFSYMGDINEGEKLTFSSAKLINSVYRSEPALLEGIDSHLAASIAYIGKLNDANKIVFFWS